MLDITTKDDFDRILAALGEQLEAVDKHYELVVIGGSGLVALGFIDRSTRDVDIVAIGAGDAISSAKPLPKPLLAARNRVARDFSLPDDWLNPGPTDLLELGMPDGFLARLTRREFGPGLTVLLASRYDQIHFKLYALADQGPGKHEDDLNALRPTDEELLTAARWAKTHDTSEAFAAILAQVLAHLGVEDVDSRA